MTGKASPLGSFFYRHFNLVLSGGILLVLIIITSSINPHFLTAANLLGLLEQNAARGVLAIGITFVLITGGIDLSIGHMMATVAVVSTVIHFNTGHTLVVLIVCCILFGILSGCVNGFLITKLKLLPFVATLIMMSIAQGITLFSVEGIDRFIRNPAVLILGSGNIGGVFPVAALVFLSIAFAAGIILHRTRFGVSVYALGGNEAAARYTGINIDRQKFKVYMLNGVFVGFAALLVLGRTGQISAGMHEGFLMDAIAASVIGGTSLLGGKGTILGTVIGVLIIGVLTSGLTFIAVPIQAQSVVKGLVIIVAIILNSLTGRLKN